MLPVTKCFLPPIGEYQALVQRAWDKRWLTNRGELVLELESKLKDYLEVDHVIVTNNGTIPIQIALRLLAGEGEVITTPFSYVATTAAIVWERCTPVFVDIHPEYLTIDEKKIEQAITPKTTAILATHVFGNSCNIEAIEAIAAKHNLKVIYDAAHSFGVKHNGRSIFTYGDVSTCSFHATKLFHTGEGGGMFCNDAELNDKLFYTHNFGHNGPLAFHGLGVNAKISELQAAMGLAVFPYIQKIMEQRKEIVNKYHEHLSRCDVQLLKIRQGTEWNYSYFPVIFESEEVLLRVQESMNRENIIPRRYFYPSLSKLPYVSSEAMPVSERIASSILCLPLYHDLPITDAERIASIIKENL